MGGVTAVMEPCLISLKPLPSRRGPLKTFPPVLRRVIGVILTGEGRSGTHGRQRLLSRTILNSHDIDRPIMLRAHQGCTSEEHMSGMSTDAGLGEDSRQMENLRCDVGQWKFQHYQKL
jgi:hypothetical protein